MGPDGTSRVLLLSVDIKTSIKVRFPTDQDWTRFLISWGLDFGLFLEILVRRQQKQRFSRVGSLQMILLITKV